MPVSDTPSPTPYDALRRDLLRGLRHEINNRAHLLGLSTPTLRAVVTDAVDHLRGLGAQAPERLGGMTLAEVLTEVDWLLTQLEEREAQLARRTDALKRALGADGTTTLAELVADARALAANILLKAGADVVAAPRGLNVPAPPRGQLLRALCCLFLETPARAVGVIDVSASQEDGEHALILTLPATADRWQAGIARARAMLEAPIALTLEAGEPPLARFVWPTT